MVECKMGSIFELASEILANAYRLDDMRLGVGAMLHRQRMHQYCELCMEARSKLHSISISPPGCQIMLIDFARAGSTWVLFWGKGELGLRLAIGADSFKLVLGQLRAVLAIVRNLDFVR
jgi:hypothetical protein